MKFLVLLIALLFEQVRPLRRNNPLHAGYDTFARFLRSQFDAGEYRQGVAAWVIAVVPITVGVFVAEWLLYRVSAPLALLWGIVVLYVTVGFRQFSYFYNEINIALKDGDVATARAQLARWRAEDSGELTPGEVARVAIELGLTASHRNVFGPVVWFVALGPAGALLYRTASALEEHWSSSQSPESGASEAFARFAVRAFEIIDWGPARLTAASFAVVGNFQDAADCWRMQARSWAHQAEGIILAGGAGALGVKLGGELHEYGRVRYRPELGTGDDADVDYLSSTVGLIWRALVLWMFLIGIVTLAHSLG
jgi:cobalamin biosynthesis protein CobD/CbiB